MVVEEEESEFVLEEATALIGQHNPGFAAAAKNMVMQHYRDKPLPEWWKKVAEHFGAMTVELYRANGAVDARARKLLFHHAKRGEYVGYYLAAVEALRKAALARGRGKTGTAIEELEKAVEAMYDAAVLGEYAFRPLAAEYERLLKESESEE